MTPPVGRGSKRRVDENQAGSVPAESLQPSAPADPESPAEVRRGHRFDLGDRSWSWQANCMGVDPDLFFPERGASTREAKAVCRGCGVREGCLEYALVNGEKFGIWGGLSERERRRLRRERAEKRASTLGAGDPTDADLADLDGADEDEDLDQTAADEADELTDVGEQ